MSESLLSTNLSSMNLSQDTSKLFKQQNSVNQLGKKQGDLLFPSPLNEQANQPVDSNLNEEQSASPIPTNQIENIEVTVSTEVYLSGMTNSENPAGLLPRFSSWSLVSIGKFSQYNPHTGK